MTYSPTMNTPLWADRRDLYIYHAGDEQYEDLLLKARVLGTVMARSLPAFSVKPPEEDATAGMIADTMRRIAEKLGVHPSEISEFVVARGEG